jgi:glycosyltransferase involved in cell wall biosynthesis
MNNKVSGLVIVKNGEKTISNCLSSLEWCNEIVVIDDFSTDQTVEIAERHGAKIYQRKMRGDFAAQRNFAMNKSKFKWVFFVDADEVVTEQLREEILFKLNNRKKEVAAYEMRRIDFFLGKQLKWGGAGTSYFRRLLRKDKNKWVNSIFEFPKTDGKVKKLKCKLIHKRQENVSEYFKKVNFYSTLDANLYYEKGKKVNVISMVKEPVMMFGQQYISKKGVLDGIPGFTLSVAAGVTKLLTQIKLWELYQQEK